MGTELVKGSEVRAEGSETRLEGSLKRASTELEQEEVAINVIPLATKPPSIVDWKIYKEGQTSYYQITRVDGSSKMGRLLGFKVILMLFFTAAQDQTAQSYDYWKLRLLVKKLMMSVEVSAARVNQVNAASYYCLQD
ncbi:hypothetical protein Tco_0021123, partial [Tanacetum coccineum]